MADGSVQQSQVVQQTAPPVPPGHLRHEVFARWHDARYKPDRAVILAVAVAVAFLLVSCFPSRVAPPGDTTLRSVCSDAVAVGSMCFSATLAILAIVSALPDSRFRKVLVQGGTELHSPYGDLIFILSLACQTQFVLVASAVSMGLAAGNRQLFRKSDILALILGSALVGLLSLALLLTLDAVRTLRQVALLQGRFLMMEDAPAAEPRCTCCPGRESSPCTSSEGTQQADSQRVGT